MKLVASESLNFAVFRTAFEQGKELGEEEEITTQTLIESMQNFGRRTGVDVRPSMGWGTLLQAIYEEVAESSTVAPTFYTDFPETSPLTRQQRKDPLLTEKGDLIVFGSELATACSELVDPVFQRKRLLAALSGYVLVCR